MELQLFLALSLLALANACHLLDGGPMKCDLIKEVLDLHNQLRSDVVNGKKGDLPEGKNMFALKWKKELETGSQEWANNCKFKHSGGETYGENLAIKSFSSNQIASVNHLVTQWIRELDKPYTYGGYEKGKGIGHLTQMIWANTKYVGCGLSYYKKEDSDIPYETYLVCRYEPAGNYRNEVPYEKGEGTKCDNGFDHKKYHGLCAHDKNDQEDLNYNPCGTSGSALATSILYFIAPLLSFCLLNDFL